MQHGYGDQQEDHGCWEMRNSPGILSTGRKVTFCQDLQGSALEAQELSFPERASLTLFDMGGIFAVTLRGNCGNTDPATSAPTIGPYLTET